MDTVILHHFLTLTETLSITKAAEKLGKSESVLSRQMSRLEDEWGLTLFIRGHNGLSLTPAGSIMRDCVADMYENLAAARDKALSVQSGNKDVINIGIIYNHVLTENARDMFSDFRNAHPEISLSFFSYRLSDLIKYMNDGKLDFVYGAPVDFAGQPEFFSIVTDCADHYLLVSKDHPALKKGIDKLSLRDFRDDTFLVLGGHQKSISSLSELCAAFGFTPKFRAVQEQALLLAMVQFGDGVSCVDDTSMFYGHEQFATVCLPELGTMPLGLIGRRTGGSHADQLLIQFVTNRCKGR